MIELLHQWWRSLKHAMTRGRRRQTSIALSPATLRQEKLPKIVDDEEEGLVHEFDFTEAQPSGANIFRRMPYPKLKRDTHDRVTIRSSWRAL
jgi:two-component sensor histidine kinase